MVPHRPAGIALRLRAAHFATRLGKHAPHIRGLQVLLARPGLERRFLCTRPVLPDPIHFDSANYQQEFFGGWATYKAIPKSELRPIRTSSTTVHFRAQQLPVHDGRRTMDRQPELTIYGKRRRGSNSATTPTARITQAGFVTGGVGQKWADDCWKPQLWAITTGPGGNVRGRGNGFNQLFPLSHKYLGFMDLFGRSNIQSPNVQLTMQPQ